MRHLKDMKILVGEKIVKRYVYFPVRYDLPVVRMSKRWHWIHKAVSGSEAHYVLGNQLSGIEAHSVEEQLEA